jgi:hypothetical protein
MVPILASELFFRAAECLCDSADAKYHENTTLGKG